MKIEVDMDILCLMGLFPEEYRDRIQEDSLGGMQYAADKLQWAIVKGLDQIDDVKISIANSMYIGSYPKRYKKMNIPTFAFKHSEKAENDVNIGFCNLSGYKFFSRYITAKKVIKHWAKQKSNDEKVLLVYALTTPFCQLADYVKKHFNDVKVCIVVPDLPEFMSTSQKKNWRSRIKSIEIRLLKKATRQVDCFVFLADAMKEWFSTPVKYTVVEGIAMVSAQPTPPVSERKKSIIYAGGIKKEYGVVDLVEAFIKVNDPEWELVIYGSGSAVDEIKQLCADRTNVKLMGSVPNSEVVAAQKTASLLVNPRKNQIFTKYSFPSKVLEYMSSGTPMLAYKLDGVPDDYDGYYYRIDEEENGFIHSLEHVMALSDQARYEMGEKAKQFVVDNKNPKTQCQKIIDLINRCEI